MKLSLPATPKPRVEMLPLIDIVFLLLVFFIYAMLSMAVHRGLPVDLPDSAAAKTEREDTLAVTVKREGKTFRIFIDAEEVALNDLRGALKKKIRSGKGNQPGVLLFADRGTSYQEIFAVLDRINQAGISRISLQADAD